jgi:hypothetical protein
MLGTVRAKRDGEGREGLDTRWRVLAVALLLCACSAHGYGEPAHEQSPRSYAASIPDSQPEAPVFSERAGVAEAPLFGLISFRGAQHKEDNAKIGIAPALYTRFTGRKPALYNGGWFYQSDTPGEIETQRITNQILSFYATRGVDFVFYDEYGLDWPEPPFDYTAEADKFIALKISNGIFYHRASPNAANVKFAVNIVCDWFSSPKSGTTWGYLTEHATAIRALFDDPNYQRFHDLPIVGLYNGGYKSPFDGSTFVEHWPEVKAILGDVWIIVTDNKMAQFKAFGAHAMTAYGNNGSSPGRSAGRWAYSAQQGVDLGITTANDARPLHVGFLNLTGTDARPRGGKPIFTDYPAHDDLLATLRAMAPLTPEGRRIDDIVVATAADEFDEGELADPTRDNSTEVLDAVGLWKRALDGEVPYTYKISTSTHYVTKNGSGWATATGIDLAHHNEEQRSSTAGDTLTLTRTGTAFAFYGTQEPTQGRFSVVIDDREPTVVDAGRGKGGTNTLLWAATGLEEKSHTVVVTVLGEHEKGTTDEVSATKFTVTYIPR